MYATVAPAAALSLLPATQTDGGYVGQIVTYTLTLRNLSFNVEPDLSHFDGIVPCGVSEHGVTSLVDLGLPVTLDEADAALKAAFERIFGPVTFAEPPLDAIVRPVVSATA